MNSITLSFRKVQRASGMTDYVYGTAAVSLITFFFISMAWFFILATECTEENGLLVSFMAFFFPLCELFSLYGMFFYYNWR